MTPSYEERERRERELLYSIIQMKGTLSGKNWVAVADKLPDGATRQR